MAVRYDASDSAILSPKALNLAKSAEAAKIEQFAAQNEVAENLLGFADIVIPDRYLPRAILAIAMQVNYQLEMGIDPFVTQHTNVGIQGGRGGQSVTYRGFNSPPILHAQAAEIANAVVQEVRGLRGGGVQSVRGGKFTVKPSREGASARYLSRRRLG